MWIREIDGHFFWNGHIGHGQISRFLVFIWSTIDWKQTYLANRKQPRKSSSQKSRIISVYWKNWFEFGSRKLVIVRLFFSLKLLYNAADVIKMVKTRLKMINLEINSVSPVFLSGSELSTLDSFSSDSLSSSIFY